MLENLITAFLTQVRGKYTDAATSVIALEGQSYAGKSSTLAALRHEGYGSIREYSAYKTAPSPDHFVLKASEQAKEDFLFYLDIERRRYHEFLEEGLKDSLCFLDRSIFTLVAYRFAILHLDASIAAILPWAIETILSDAYPILYPTHTLYIDIPLCLVKQRHQRAGDHLPAYFMDEIFYETFRAFFLTFHAMYPNAITVIDGSHDAQSTLRQIHEIIETKTFAHNG